MAEDVPTAKPTYLLMLRPDLVAQDIALTITDHVPDANVILVRNMDEGMAALEGLTEIVVAIMAMDPETYALSELGHAVRARRGRVVLMGEAAEAARKGPEWIALMRPFSTDYLLNILDGNNT